MTLLYFVLSGADILGVAPKAGSPDALRTVEWVLAQQTEHGGFSSGPGIPHPMADDHLAMTYCALSILKILGTELPPKESILRAVHASRMSTGCFSCLSRSSESDMRFVYCACAISFMLDDFSAIDVDSTTRFIVESQSYDGAFGMGPGQEGHGGSTFVAVASLALLGKLNAIGDREKLVKWCLNRQGDGYHGRPNKPNDTCYSFWVGATLDILGASNWTNPEGNHVFNLLCQTPYGGFSKTPNVLPDILHSYLGLAGTALLGLDNDSLPHLNVVLNTSLRATPQVCSCISSVESWLLD